jgi:hypothetical protein
VVSSFTRLKKADSTHYVIRDGLEGRERLWILVRVMHASLSLFDRFGPCGGLTCLDADCGGGDARRWSSRAGPAWGVCLVTGKPSKTKLSPPFSKVRGMGLGHQIHHKFVVCGFNGKNPVTSPCSQTRRTPNEASFRGENGN